MSSVELQSTLSKPVTIEGVGLHTGAKVCLTLNPAAENYGYKFQRIDLPKKPVVEVDVDNVVDTSRGTTIAQNGGSVSTIEHVMAALVGMSVDNVLLEIDGPEVPILDGSAMPFVQAIEEVGITLQTSPREYFYIPENIHYKDEERNVEIVAIPSEEYRLVCMIDFNSPVLGTQHTSIFSLNEFRDEIASSRTFCFLHEVETLLKENLIKGGDLNNAIVVVDKEVSEDDLKRLAKNFNRESIGVAKEGILNNIELRYLNEPARHKLLDMLGDLALIGMPVKGQIMAARPGHAANVAFAKLVKNAIKKKNKQTNKEFKNYDPNVEPIYDYHDIVKMLPHKPPFLFLDKVIEVGENYIVGVKNVTIGDFFFDGHFPDFPVMPGVLQVEAMAQLGGILVLHELEDPEKYLTFFLKINECKFKGKVMPGDTLIMRSEFIQPVRRGLAVMHGTIMVRDKIVCEADLMAQIIKQ